MDDLRLWALLDAEELDADATLPLVIELAALPLHMRAPFFGSIGRALRHPSAALRSAALRALFDATGPFALRAMVSALDDGDPSVHEAAVDALRSIGAKQPTRFAHALFHRDPRVRALAVKGELPPQTATLAFYLLADAELAAEVEARGVRPANQALDVVIEFTNEGRLSPIGARRILAETAPTDVIAWSVRAPFRGPVEVHRVIASQGEDHAGHDRFDDLFALFLRAPADDPYRARFFRVWTDHMWSAAWLAERLVASIAVAMRRETYAADAVALAALQMPGILAWNSIPRSVREGSLDAIYAAGPRREAPEPTRDALLICDLVRRPKGGLDLRFLGALLCFVPMPRYGWLVDRLGKDAIIDAFLRDMEHGARFLSILDRSTQGGEWMLRQITTAAREDQRPAIYALFACVSTGADLVPLSALAPLVRLAVIDRLFDLEHHDTLGFDGDHAKAIAHAVVLPDLVGHESALLECWLRRRESIESALGAALLARMSERWKSDALIDALAALPTYPLRRLLAALDTAPLLTLAQERALAARLIDHTSPKIAAWADGRTPKAPPSTVEPIGARDVVTEIPGWLATRIRTVPDLEDGTIQRLHGAPSHGLCAALAARRIAPTPCVGVAVALLGAHDPISDVAAWFEKFAAKDAVFLSALDAAIVAAWNGLDRLPLVCDAWMWRFEKHGLRALDTMIGEGLVKTLQSALELTSPTLTESFWAAAGSSIAVWRYRFRERLVELVDEALFDLCIDVLDTRVGYWAARILVAFHESRVAVEALSAREARVRARLPDLSDEVRRTLASYVALTGLASRTTSARAEDRAVAKELLEEIRCATDLDALASWCRSGVLRAVHEATLRLVVLGEPGCEKIAELLAEEPPLLHLDALAASIPLWPPGADALDRLRRLLALGAGTHEVRFRIALGLLDHDDEDAFDIAVREACAPSSDPWMSERDFTRLRDRAKDPDALSRALAISPHPHAYLWAVERIVRAGAMSDEDRDALRAFLARGTDRAIEARVSAATVLMDHGDTMGLPILAGAGLAEEATSTTVLVGADAREIERAVLGVLFAGGRTTEMKVLAWLDDARVDRGGRELALEVLLAEADDEKVRAAVVQRLPRRPSRAIKLGQLAQTFAWGVVAARELLGRVYRIHMISTEAFGYTRLNERRIYVTPLPLLRGERRGREVVEGLILHELGHHRHHAGPANQEVWNRAHQKGLGKLLNLVADEHLERNLRGVDPTYGDRLKRLAAYAFQHAAREIDVWVLVSVLGARTLPILSACRLAAARRPTSVRVDTGEVLTELEASGSSFAKFVRALRMGLGKRHADPRVDEALDLFSHGFRKSNMERLYEITLELHRIFGAEVSKLDAFGGAESLEDSSHDRITDGEGIDDAEVQRAVERILGPPGESKRGDRPSGRGRLQINVGADESFEPIHEVVRVEPDPVSHREVAKRVARHARRLRETLERLGLAREATRMRLSGHRLDTTRIRPLVTHGDPRVLMARKTVVKSDLYLGIVIDCSGSMHGESMDRAHAFGVLLAEAVRGLRGVDLGIFGFDDHVIFDAGDARRPAVTSLEAGAGNNDAAGLLHAAEAAMASHRKAKVLVMISDGLPTECSVDALRGLVKNLTRRHRLCCAQIAVRPLEEICFPHYVEIDDDNMDAAVRKFGNIVARLVGRTLSA